MPKLSWLAAILASSVFLVACNGGNQASSTGNPSSTSTSELAPSERQDFPTRSIVGRVLTDQVIVDAQPTGNVDELSFNDLQGGFDNLIPVSAEYPIPDIPSRMFDVATMRDGRMVRPHIPATRTTVDGRVGVSMTSYVGRRVDISGGRAISFVLYAPEKLAEKNVHVSQANDGSSDMMASKIFWVNETEFLGKDSPVGLQMLSVCDSSLAQLDKELYSIGPGGAHRNPYPINSTDEAYDLHLVTANRNNRAQIVSIPVRVVVKNAKTAQAQIARIESLGAPLIATMSSAPITVFEPTITGDGRLLVYRTSGTPGQGGGSDALQPREWTDNEGKTHRAQFDIVYAYNAPDSGFAPCDPRGWMNPRPITYAHHDQPVRERYGFAKFPFRDPEGRVLGPGEESGMTYPWIDSRGANLFFTGIYRLQTSDETTYVTNEDFEMGQSLSTALDTFPAQVSDAYQKVAPASPAAMRPNLMLPAKHIVPVPGTCKGTCTNSTTTEHASSTRGASVAGLWTEGKMVLLDGLFNATDFGYQAFDSSQRLLRLYHGKGGVVRVGNGRTNTDKLSFEQFIDPYWPLNDSMTETHENKFNFFTQWKPASPKDVAWIVSSGRASTEVSFDDFMDPSAVILSNMQPSMSLNPIGPIKWLKPNTGDRIDRPIRLQNAATGTSAGIPAYGDVVGNAKQGTRIEPVALGGIEGKGLWLTSDSGARYQVGQLSSFPINQLRSGAYWGVFIDPRTKGNQSTSRWVLRTPSGVAALKGESGKQTLILGTDLSKAQVSGINIELPPQVKEGQYFHLGLNKTPEGLEVFINGFLWRSVPKSIAGNLFAMSMGAVQLGGDESVSGQRGWYDNFEVFNRSLVDEEEACIRAMGSLIKVKQGQGAHADYPLASHQRISNKISANTSQRYECHRDSKTEGWGFLTKVPASQRVGSLVRQIKPLVFNQPRPAETDNVFCVSCHRSPHPSITMSLDALIAAPKPMQFDRRRQPLQPNAAVTGVIPPNWSKLVGESNVESKPQAYASPGTYLLIDSVMKR